MSEKYERPTIGQWLRPTMIGPFLSVYVGVTLYALFGPLPDLIPRPAYVVVGLAVGTIFAFLYTLVLVAVDLLLLVLKLRALPSGKNAWLMAIGSPLAALACYAVYSPHKWYKFGPWAIVIAVLIPALASALGTRVFAGQKVQAKR